MAKYRGYELIEKTKRQYMGESDQQKGLPQPDLADHPVEGQALIDLPDAKQVSVGQVDLFTAINNRVSVRRYADQPLTLDELSYLLWCTQGVKQVTTRPATLRTVPSAGSRHAFETYLLINRVEGLKPGLYRYFAVEHKLAAVDLSDDIADRITQGCGGQIFVKNGAVAFLWAAVTYRMFWRYQERGFRYLHLDAGHVCQNLYLACEAIGAGTCAIAAFDDDAINQTLGLDGEERFLVYVAPVGKK